MEQHKSKRERQLEIWNNLTPKQRDYDRYVGQIPAGACPAFETIEAQNAHDKRMQEREEMEEGCSCHINPPCSYCVNKPEE